VTCVAAANAGAALADVLTPCSQLRRLKPPLLTRAPRRLVTGAVIVAMAASSHAFAGQVVLDGTLGPAGARLGPNFVIPQSLGRLQGTNLFHSFSQFNISAGESATFTANAGTTVTNVIARVTGTSSSNINGLVRSDIPNANLFLINPNGIVFGPMAQLDVQGSFVASSASYVRLADGVRFSTVAPNDALLTSAPPAAFGFLGKTAGPVTFTGPAGGFGTAQGGVLSVPQGQSIALIGGPVQVTGGQLQAQGGQVAVVSVAGKGEVALDVSSSGSTPTASPGTVLGPVQLTGGANLSAPVGGRVVVRSGSLDVNASSIVADTDVVPGGGIDLLVTGAMSLENGLVSAQTTGPARGGSICISAATLSMIGVAEDESAPISVTTSSTGASGDVMLKVGSLNIGAEASVQAFTEPPADSPTLATGPGGSITVKATRQVRIDGTGAGIQTGLAAETRGAVSGPAGNITVTAPSVDLISEGEITDLTKGSGNAGAITLHAGTLFIDGRNATQLTGLQGRVGEGLGDIGAGGAGGRIEVTARRIKLVNGGVITASTFGSGQGGTIDVSASSLSIAGSAGSQFTGVFAQSFPVANLATPGGGGAIHVKAGNLAITGPAQMLAGISAQSLAGGAAGTVSVQAGNVQVGGGGTISVQAQGGSAGNLFVDSAGNIVIRGGSISAQGQTAGTVTVQAHNVQVGRDGEITVQAPMVGGGIAGTLTVIAASDLVVRHGEVSAVGETGGTIHLNAGRFIYLFHGEVTARATDNGLQLLLDPPAVVLDGRSTIDGRAGGRAVIVQIHGSLLQSLDSKILTNSGRVFPQVDLTSALIALQANLGDANTRLAPTCGASLGGDVSSFVVTGRGGIAPEPDDWQPDFILKGP
jgi:filamentous hemagglutinin family protein